MELKKKEYIYKKITRFLLILLMTGFILYTHGGINSVYAQSNGNAYDVELQEELLLDLPDVTENPNYTITFTDPGGDGVTLDIDNQGEKTITSPYELPTLGIGEHELVFKFSDNEEVAQTLIKEIVIIPRPPQINTPELINSKIFLSGVGVAGGKSELFITDGNDEWRVETEIDKSGAWTYDMEENLGEGSYSVVAIARKNGYASKYSEPASFILEKSEDNKSGEQTIEQRIIWDNLTLSSLPAEIKKMFNNNPRVLAALLGFPLLLGIILGLLFKLLFSSKSTKRAERMLREALDGKQNKNSKKRKEKKDDKTVSKSVLVEKLKGKLEADSTKTSSEEKTDSANKSSNDKDKDDHAKPAEENIKDKEKKNDVIEEEEKDQTKESSNEDETKKEIMASDENKTDEEPELTDEQLEEIEEFEKKPEKKKKKGIFSKAEFLKKFKNFDPDDDEGKEETEKKDKSDDQKEIESKKDKKKKKKNDKKSKSEKSEQKSDDKKRNISISLTSGDNVDQE